MRSIPMGSRMSRIVLFLSRIDCSDGMIDCALCALYCF